VNAPRGPVWVVGSDRTVERWCHALSVGGIDAVALPWSEVVAPADPEAVGDALSTRPDLVCLTSGNAARFVPSGAAAGLPAACVGEASARAAVAAGFRIDMVGRGGAADLARRILAERPAARSLLHLRGADALDDLPDLLRASGRDVRSVVAYATRARPRFPSEVAAAPDPSALIVGSPLAAAALDAALLASARTALRAPPCVALGEATALRLRSLSFPDVRVAASPDPDAILHSLHASRS
jgi:uroporphyrinogen-III synthase